MLEGVTETKVVNQKANTYKLRNQSAKGFQKKKKHTQSTPKKTQTTTPHHLYHTNRT